MYVSGQGSRRPDGSLPATFAAQARQALENVKSVVEAAGLTMEHVVYTQVYLEDISKYAEMNQGLRRSLFQNEDSARQSRARRCQTSRAIDSDQRRRGTKSGPTCGLCVRRVTNPSNKTKPFSPGVLTADRLVCFEHVRQRSLQAEKFQTIRRPR